MNEARALLYHYCTTRGSRPSLPSTEHILPKVLQTYCFQVSSISLSLMMKEKTASVPNDGSKTSDTGDASNPLIQYQAFRSQNELPDTQQTIVLHQVFQDLGHIRKWTNLRVAKSETRTYLAGSAPSGYDSVFPGRADEKDLDRTQLVVPVPSSEMFSPRAMQLLCRECLHPETKLELRCITLAIVDDDSTTAYYRIFDKWQEIVHPQWKMKKKPKLDEAQGTEARTGKQGEDKNSSGDSDSDSD